MFLTRILLILSFSVPCFSADKPLFTTITLDEFGDMPNQQKSMQASARIPAKGNTSLRTNNWQNLQLISASDPIANPTRVGPYSITQSPEGIGVGFPYQINNDGVALISQANFLLFSCTEKGQDSFNQVMKIPSSDKLRIDYSFGTSKISDYNITANAFHDMRFINATPKVQTSSGIITKITTYKNDGTKDEASASPNFITPEGNAFEITISPLPNVTQTWLLIAEPEGETLTLQLDATQTTLTSLNQVDLQFIRCAILQPSDVNVNVTAPPQTPRCWSTAALIQTIAPTPISMYTLWPVEWLQLFANQFYKEYQAGYEMPVEIYISLLLPVISRVNVIEGTSMTGFELAKTFFDKMDDKDFDDGTSRFLTYFNMLLARDLDEQIEKYQSEKENRIYPSAPSLEQVREALLKHRHSIPLKCQISVTEDALTWSYETYNGVKNPLLCFPAYQSLTTQTELANFFVQDPIKGSLYSAATNELSFSIPKMPEWFPESLFPPDLPKFSPEDLDLLKTAYQTAKNLPLNLKNSYYRGKQIHGLALAVKYRELLSKLLNETEDELILATKDPIDRIKKELTSWFVTRDQTDYFIGDSTTKGVCATPAGLEGHDGADFGNEVYTDHHFHYGYWLGAASVVVDWDNHFSKDNQWIATPVPIENKWWQIFQASSFKMKYAVDMLWRDTRNPDPQDPELPVSRYMDFWEGHSIANGFNTPPYASGRNQESLAEDFLCWINTALYAQNIFCSSALDNDDKKNFDYLRDYSKAGAQTSSIGGKLYYRTSDWMYADSFQNEEIVTIGNQWDTAVDTQTFFPPN